MAKKTLDKTPSGPQLDILTAQKVFGWKNVHKHNANRGFYRKTKSIWEWFLDSGERIAALGSYGNNS